MEELMSIKEWQKKVHKTARLAGRYDGELGEKTDLRLISMLWLIHSEVSEALEDVRNNNMELAYGTTDNIINDKPVGFPSKLADIIIRVLDMAEWLDIDLEEIIRIKNDYNNKRGYKHGGGKKV